MNALMSWRPRRGSCREYLSSMSGEAISSTTARLTCLPQNSVNQRPTMALLSSCLLIGVAPHGLPCERIIATGRCPQQRTKLGAVSRNSGSYFGIGALIVTASITGGAALRSPVEIGCGRVAITATPGGGRGHLASLHSRYVHGNHRA